MPPNPGASHARLPMAIGSSTLVRHSALMRLGRRGTSNASPQSNIRTPSVMEEEIINRVAVGCIDGLGDFLVLVIVRLRAKPVALAVFAGPNSELVLFCVMSRAFYLRK